MDFEVEVEGNVEVKSREESEDVPVMSVVGTVDDEENKEEVDCVRSNDTRSSESGPYLGPF